MCKTSEKQLTVDGKLGYLATALSNQRLIPKRFASMSCNLGIGN
jgi:hypothetical protein